MKGTYYIDSNVFLYPVLYEDIEETEKIRKLKGIIDEIAPHVRIEVDGGVTDITGRLLKESGADIIVSASYIYGGNIRERIRILKNI